MGLKMNVACAEGAGSSLVSLSHSLALLSLSSSLAAHPSLSPLSLDNAAPSPSSKSSAGSRRSSASPTAVTVNRGVYTGSPGREQRKTAVLAGRAVRSPLQEKKKKTKTKQGGEWDVVIHILDGLVFVCVCVHLLVYVCVVGGDEYRCCAV